MTMRLFISYSHQDEQFVRYLATALEEQQFEVWIDRENIQGGDAWRKSIVQGINDCDSFIVVLSTSSTTSRNVVKEISIADERHKRIFPVLCEACTIPEEMEYQLTGLQYVDLSRNNFPAGFASLVSALRGTPQQTPQYQPQPAQAPVPQPAPQPPTQVFSPIGVWQVQVQHPYTGIIAYGQVTYAAGGQFNLGLNTAQGAMQAQGQWQLAGQQLVMQGIYAYALMPYNMMPYSLAIQIMAASTGAFNGVAHTGEQVVFQRVG